MKKSYKNDNKNKDSLVRVMMRKNIIKHLRFDAFIFPKRIFHNFSIRKKIFAFDKYLISPKYF